MVPLQHLARRACALAGVLVVLLTAPTAAQPAQGISLQDICSVPARYVAASKRAVTGTSCTVYVDCTVQPLAAQACRAGQRFSFNDQQCVAAASTPCYEEQFPSPAGAATNRALANVVPAEPANQTADAVRVVAWTPSDWQVPTPATPGSPVMAAAAGGDGQDAMRKNTYNYLRTCNTVAFEPERHTPPSSSGVTVPASVAYLKTCTVCYPAILCPGSPKFSASVKGDYVLHITTDYYACPAGQQFDGQTCSDVTAAAAAPAAAAASVPVTGSVLRGIDCDSMRAALAGAGAPGTTTFALHDTSCNATMAPMEFALVNTTGPVGQEVLTLNFKTPSLLRWTQGLMYNSTTGVRGKSGADQFTVNPTSMASFVAHTSASGACAFVPLVNGTAQPPAPGALCPNASNPVTFMTVKDMPWAAVGMGGAIGAGTVFTMVSFLSMYETYAAGVTVATIDGVAVSSYVPTTIITEAGEAIVESVVTAASAAGAIVGIALLVAAIILLALILAGVIPPDMGINSGCFPASATVLGLLATSSMLAPMPMGQLALGDSIATAALAPSGVYGAGVATSPVYLWGHQAGDVVATFVELQTASGHTLQLTGGHFLHSWPLPAAASPAPDSATALAAPVGCHVAGAVAPRMKRAQDVAPEAGDALCVYDDAAGTFALSPVVAKRLVRAQGLFAPFTTTGDLVVNGVLVSAHSDWILDRVVPDNAAHHLPAVYQLLMWPARAAYALGGRRLMEFLDTRLRLVELASAVRL